MLSCLTSSSAQTSQKRRILQLLNLASQFDALEFPVSGLRYLVEADDCECYAGCPSCGEGVVTRHWKVVEAESGDSIKFDALALHLLEEHGQFSCRHEHHGVIAAPDMVRERLAQFFRLSGDDCGKDKELDGSPFLFGLWLAYPSERTVPRRREHVVLTPVEQRCAWRRAELGGSGAQLLLTPFSYPSVMGQKVGADGGIAPADDQKSGDTAAAGYVRSRVELLLLAAPGPSNGGRVESPVDVALREAQWAQALGEIDITCPVPTSHTDADNTKIHDLLDRFGAGSREETDRRGLPGQPWSPPFGMCATVHAPAAAEAGSASVECTVAGVRLRHSGPTAQYILVGRRGWRSIA